MIKDLKDLQSLLKLCRKQGVIELSMSDLVIKFGDLPLRKTGDTEESDEISSDTLTPEQLIFYSAPMMGE